MPYSTNFVNYNAKYNEIREIFEYLFPISENQDRAVYELHKIMKNYLEDFDSQFFELVRNESIFGKKKNIRTCIEHHSYNINNELWYNLIFTMYHNNPKDTSDPIEYTGTEGRLYATQRNPNKNMNFFSAVNGDAYGFNDDDLYNYFWIMDKFAPFSTIGFWMFKRMTNKMICPHPMPMIFHGGNPRNGGLQEILYQVSYIIQCEANSRKHILVYVNKTGPFIFKQVVYEDISLYQEKNNPYILSSCIYQGKEVVVKIYIQGNMDLKIKGNVAIENPMNLDQAQKEGHVEVVNHKKIFTYNFYLITNRNVITGDYLIKKVLNEGKKYGDVKRKRSYLNEKAIIYNQFKYYGYNENKWDLFQYEFIIYEKNKDSFERWADSFGDFVFWQISEEKECQADCYYAFFKKDKNAFVRVKSLPTLLMYENSWEKLNQNRVSLLELNWMVYTLQNYPNFSKMLLNTLYTESSNKTTDEKNAEKKFNRYIDYLKGIVKSTIRNENLNMENELDILQLAEANPFSGFCKQTKDLSENHIRKLRIVLDSMKNADHRTYYKCRKSALVSSSEAPVHNEVLPYAVDFDVMKYNGADKGIFVMAYDLVQKRIVAIPFKDFTIGESSGESDGKIVYKYSNYDKVYYFCSYVVKLYFYDKKDAWKLIQMLFDIQIPEKQQADFLSEIKKYNIKDHLAYLGENVRKLFECSILPWVDYATKNGWKSQMQLDIKNNGTALFTKKEIKYKTMVGQAMLYIIENLPDWIACLDRWMPDPICEELIIGNTYLYGVYEIFLSKYDDNIPDDIIGFLSDIDKKSILNEIQYMNSTLKIHELVFKLKDGCYNSKNIELIYDCFRNFNCAGKQLKNEKSVYIFKIQFEGFAYRKVHEILLSLSSIIQIPEDVFFDSVRPNELTKKEQMAQSKLISYRSKEGKEKLKQAILEQII